MKLRCKKFLVNSVQKIYLIWAPMKLIEVMNNDSVRLFALAKKLEGHLEKSQTGCFDQINWGREVFTR